MSSTSSTSQRLRIAILLVASVLVGLAATSTEPASAAPSGAVPPGEYLVYKQAPVYDRYAFRSPSGNIRCSITQWEDSRPWGCSVVHRTWKDPELPYLGAPCGKGPDARVEGAVFAEYPGSGFFAICGSDGVLMNESSKVLPTGSSISVHRITCTSTRVAGREAMTCTGPRRAKFVVSRTTVAVMQPKR